MHLGEKGGSLELFMSGPQGPWRCMVAAMFFTCVSLRKDNFSSLERQAWNLLKEDVHHLQQPWGLPIVNKWKKRLSCGPTMQIQPHTPAVSSGAHCVVMSSFYWVRCSLHHVSIWRQRPSPECVVSSRAVAALVVQELMANLKRKGMNKCYKRYQFALS